MKKTSNFSKILLFLVIDFGLRLVFSCNPPPPEEINFNYNKIDVVGVDNSGQYLNANNAVDTMYAGAVALKLSLSDTTFYPTAYYQNIVQELFSFQSAYATSVARNFIPLEKVESIQIKTLMDINPDIKAGDDVTEHFLYASNDNFSLYQDLGQGIEQLNSVQSDTKSDIVLILNKTVQNTSARFEVKLTLDNGTTLSCTTELFTIIEP